MATVMTSGSESGSGMSNLVRWWNDSSPMDREYGLIAYRSYRDRIGSLTSRTSPEKACAVFALLSPNSDFNGNVRSFQIVMAGFRRKPRRLTVDELQGLRTYRTCAARAYRILQGEPPAKVFGPTAPKTWNFYHNLLDPRDVRFVTIDGHMYNLWRGERSSLNVAAARFKPAVYEEIAGDFKELAKALGLVPNQLQATVWWAYKRINGIKFDYQIDLDLELT